MRIVTLTKAEQVRQAILVQILSGELRPGQRRWKQTLEELGVSQATVNGALQDLHNQGLVTKLLNRSTNVSRYTRREIENLFAVRMVLEPAAAAAVAARWSPEIKEPLMSTSISCVAPRAITISPNSAWPTTSSTRRSTG